MDAVELGLRIRHAREKLGMSQEQFADAIERDQKAVSEYENGKRKLPAIELPRFAAILGVPVSYFFEGEYKLDELDGLMLQQFHALPTKEDKHTAIQALRLILEIVNRHHLPSEK